VGVKRGVGVRRDCCSSCIQAGSDIDGLELLFAVDNVGAVECALERVGASSGVDCVGACVCEGIAAPLDKGLRVFAG